MLVDKLTRPRRRAFRLAAPPSSLGTTYSLAGPGDPETKGNNNSLPYRPVSAASTPRGSCRCSNTTGHAPQCRGDTVSSPLTRNLPLTDRSSTHRNNLTSNVQSQSYCGGKSVACSFPVTDDVHGPLDKSNSVSMHFASVTYEQQTASVEGRTTPPAQTTGLRQSIVYFPKHSLSIC